MGRRRAGLVFGVWIFVFLVAVFGVVLNVPAVRSSGTIYIRADGSIDPPTAPIQRDGNLYTFLNNIFDSINVERNNIVIDGNGYTLQGYGSEYGFYLSGMNNVAIRNTDVKGFERGLYLISSSYNILSGNNITDNSVGVYFSLSGYNNVFENNITNNYGGGVYLFDSCNNNIISGNRITDNHCFYMYFYHSVVLYYSSGNILSGNIIIGNYGGDGVGLHYSSHNTLSENNITNNWGKGIQLGWSSNNNIVSKNNITKNSGSGVELYYSDGNSLIGNKITSNGAQAVISDTSSYTVISGNEIANNNPFGYYVTGSVYIFGQCNNIFIFKNNITNSGSSGVWFGGVSKSTISGNIITSHKENAILLSGSSFNNVSENDITNNWGRGIVLFESSKNKISRNCIANNSEAIYVNNYNHADNYNNIVENNITENRLRGITLMLSSNNSIYHNNFVNNANQIYTYGLVNTWNDSYPSGGNYWSDYAGADLYSGPYQNETSSDGIGDNPYVINSDNEDNYPFMRPWGWDKSPPVTIDNYDGLWHTTDFTITLTATDDMSGVAETYYRINDGPTKTAGANGQPLVTTQGANNKLEYWSTDQAGNEELPHKILTGIKLDKSAPEGSVTISDLNTYTTSTSVTLTLTSIDDTSGVDKVRFSNDGIWDTEPWETPVSTKAWILPSGDGTKTVYYQIKDNAGLTSVTYSDTIILDTVPPTTTDDFDGQWHMIEFTITLTVSDDPSGIAETYYRINDISTSFVSINGQPLITGNGANITLEYWSIDNAGNEELPHKFLTGIKLDTIPPTGDILINTGGTYTTTTLVTLTLSAVDMPSGVSQIRLSNDGTWDTEPWETPSTVLFPQAQISWTLTSGDGSKTVYFEIKDNAGHVSETYSDTIILDTTKPTANAGEDKTINEDNLVTLDGSASWDENGILEYIWTFWDASSQLLTGINHVHNFTNPGTYTVTLQVADAAGHFATDTVIITVLDTTKPVAKAGQDQTVNVGTTVTFDAGASTDNVGIISYEWNFGDGTTATGKTATHTYDNPETHTVTLTVRDAAGNTNSDTLTVTIRSAETPPQQPAEAFPMWIVGSAIIVIGIAVATTLLLRRRK